jgi:uncharacterized membrane protein YccC
MLLPEISAVADLTRELAALGGPSEPAASQIARIAGSIVAPADTAALRARLAEVDGIIAGNDEITSWRALLELNFFVRLRETLQLVLDCDALLAALAGDGHSLHVELAFPIEAEVVRVHHRDVAPASIAALALGATLILCCLFWIATGWRDGAAAAMMAAVAGSLFAAQDDPTPAIAKFAISSAVAVALAGVYVFIVLPHVHSFESLILAFAPSFLLFGLLIAEPRTFMVGLALGILTPSAMALQGAYLADAESFLNSGLAMIAGMGVAAATAAVVRTLGAEWRAMRFIGANQRALAAAADVRGGRDDALALGLMFDRLALLAPIAHAADQTMPDALRQLRAGYNLLRARHARRSLSAGARRRLDAALMRLERLYRRGLPPGDDALAALDRAMGALGLARQSDRDALIALVGLRRCLFPDARPIPIGAKS